MPPSPGLKLALCYDNVGLCRYEVLLVYAGWEVLPPVQLQEPPLLILVAGMRQFHRELRAVREVRASCHDRTGAA